MAKFQLDDGDEYWAEDCIDGHLINPRLSPEFIPVIPFIIRTVDNFSVHCMTTNGYLRCIGVFHNLNEAISRAKTGDKWRCAIVTTKQTARR
jgi:hypothetical protein